MKYLCFDNYQQLRVILNMLAPEKKETNKSYTLILPVRKICIKW